jgi:quercetin dioxygenase-like cupin family protein
MIIIPPEEQVGIVGKIGAQFTGNVFSYLTTAGDGVTINTVNFTPGARTYWHSHESGQIIQVLAGRGLIQSEGGPIEVLRAGYTVWVPAGA